MQSNSECITALICNNLFCVNIDVQYGKIYSIMQPTYVHIKCSKIKIILNVKKIIENCFLLRHYYTFNMYNKVECSAHVFFEQAISVLNLSYFNMQNFQHANNSIFPHNKYYSFNTDNTISVYYTYIITTTISTSTRHHYTAPITSGKPTHKKAFILCFSICKIFRMK